VLSDFRALFQDARNYDILKSPANEVQLGTENNALTVNDKSEFGDILELIERGITQAIFFVELRIMDWIMALSFEQDIYLSSELSRMYW